MTAPKIDPFPPFLNRQIEVTVSDRIERARFTSTEWTEHWRPLLARLHEYHTRQPLRLMVAIAGPPGTGKSVLAEQLTWLISHNILPDCRAAALPLDGFHFPHDYLKSHYRTLADSTQVPLTECKGAPDTFDVEDLRRHLQLLRDRTATTPWPGYSRLIHDTVPNRYRVSPSTNIIFVEGNYVLLDRGPYVGISAFFDFKIYIDTPPVSIVSNLVERHIAGGKSEEAAKDWVRKIDLPNARLVESTRKTADLIIERNREDDIVALHWKGETA